MLQNINQIIGTWDEELAGATQNRGRKRFLNLGKYGRSGAITLKSKFRKHYVLKICWELNL